MKARVFRCGIVLLLLGMALSTACSKGEDGLVNLSPGQQTQDWAPAWSPDGSRIAFISGLVDGSDSTPSYANWGIYVMDADGGNRLRVVSLPTRCLSWSRNGDDIVFSTEQGEIGVMDPDGSNARYVVTKEPPVYWIGKESADWISISDWPSYSPDKTRIVFGKHVWFDDLDSAAHAGPCWQILLVDPDGTNLIKLSPDGVNDYEPAWSPDGTKIAFSSDRNGQRGIYVMDADGGNVVRLTDDGYADNGPAWSPDGKRIAFISSRDGEDEVYVMNSDGSNVVRLTHNSIDEESLSWSPDGTTLAISGYNPSGIINIYALKTV